MTPQRPITLTNTMGGELQEFHPMEPGRVRMYTCGPTVYSHIHIGNFRSFVLADVLRRVLEYNGYEVTQVRNITDVGHLTDETLNTGLDKIEAMARQENRSPTDIARYYTDIFQQDARRLNLLQPHHEPRATEYIHAMIELTQHLVARAYGYPVGSNVYYEVARFPRYGALSGNSVEGLIAGARVEIGEDKRSPADFALWKFAGPEKLQKWQSPWGEGVPGWHIECSAMSRALLGDEIDIHTGGVDNIFPHHEDEIAQSEAASGKQFVHYWLHGAHLVFADVKMSRSLGNFYTLADLTERGIHPLSYRYFTFQAHYRTPLTFTWEALQGTQTALFRIWETVAENLQVGGPEGANSYGASFQERFHEAINRDLDMPSAVAIVHDLLGSKLSPGIKLSLLEDFDRVLGLDLLATGRRLSETSLDERRLLDERAAARAAKDWAASDRIRSELSDRGLELKDTPQGQRWIRRLDPVDV